MWKGIVCLLILLLCGCGVNGKSLAERYNNDTTKVLKYLDKHLSVAEPNTYSKIIEMEIYGASGESYYFNSEITDDEMIVCGGTYQRKDVYFRFETEDILCGYLIAHGIITSNADVSFVKRAFDDVSDKEMINYFSSLLDEYIYILSSEDMIVLEMEDKFDEALDFREEWNKQEIEVKTPQRKRERKELFNKIMNLK